MKRLIKQLQRAATALLFGLFFMAATPAYSQSYHVYSVRGTVKLINGKNSSNVHIRQKLDAKQKIKIEESGMIILFNVEQRKLYTINTAGYGTIKELISKSKNSVKECTNAYFRYIVKVLLGKERIVTETAYMNKTTASFRGGDSLLQMVDSLQAVQPDTMATTCSE